MQEEQRSRRIHLPSLQFVNSLHIRHENVVIVYDKQFLCVHSLVQYEFWLWWQLHSYPRVLNNSKEQRVQLQKESSRISSVIHTLHDLTSLFPLLPSDTMYVYLSHCHASQLPLDELRCDS